MEINFKKIFDWSIKSVTDAKPVFNLETGHLSGYEVIVTYVHHGDKTVFFDYNSQKLWRNYICGPQQAANAYSCEMSRKILRAHIKQNKRNAPRQR